MKYWLNSEDPDLTSGAVYVDQHYLLNAKHSG